MGPVELEMTDGAGSTLVLNRKTGISMNTDKTVNIEADGDINISSNGKVDVSGRKGVFVQQGISYIAVGKEKIEIASNNNKVN